MMLVALALSAQEENFLGHLSLSLGVGSTGITVDAGSMVNDRIALRAGVDVMPKIKYNTHLDMTIVNQTESTELSSIPWNVAVQGRLQNSTVHALLDYHPIEGSDFRVTMGAYIAAHNKIVTVANRDEAVLLLVSDFNARRGEFADYPDSYGQIAARMGEYSIMPDDEGNANAYIIVNRVRPYLGVGYGRSVPRRKSVNFQVDLGVQYIGNAHVFNGVNGQELTAEGARGEDGGWLRNISRIHVYPVLSFRIAGKLF